jgi:hypothetical protein
VIFLVNSLTIWCILKVNNALVIEESYRHHFHLASNLVCLFNLRDPGVVHCDDWAFVTGPYL